MDNRVFPLNNSAVKPGHADDTIWVHRLKTCATIHCLAPSPSLDIGGLFFICARKFLLPHNDIRYIFNL
jgi:hypothetical protein